MKKILGILSLAGMLTACGENSTQKTEEGVIVQNDFDSLQGWIPETPSLNREQAHSGTHSIKVGPGVEYGLTFSSLLGTLSGTKMHKVTINGWVYLPKINNSASLVFQITDPKQNDDKIIWEPIKLASVVEKSGQWQKFTKEITLPENVSYDHKMSVYLWANNAGEPAYLDDLKIVAE
ncbi:carbohydrate binding domain-containing protein [Hymenobacter psychrophilus]|uniref:Carbohydrate binding domain-containing protein n=1 Tax=Hymenobacter psychrophilus TaxID=651662 RepID=A0A1H3HIY7_9BACT|nr:carbohydrate binding domain-containing protein [Hymenobacter psychrophilus]SDY15175.1 Carbohydrate binding domain-containing protein [Hymenobacter psychrophilus]